MTERHLFFFFCISKNRERVILASKHKQSARRESLENAPRLLSAADILEEHNTEGSFGDGKRSPEDPGS